MAASGAAIYHESIYSINTFSDELVNIDACPWTKTGYSFHSWNDMPNGTGTSYSPGDTVYLSANVNLYAQWEPET